MFLCFINDKEKSEGMLMELGMAYSLWKQIILLVNNKVKWDYYLLYPTSEKIIYFNEIKELEYKLVNFLNI
jgi:hypothetical protein